MASTVQRYPSGFGRLLCALDFYLGTPKEIALVGDLDEAKLMPYWMSSGALSAQ